MSTLPTPKRFTVDEYYHMAEAGIIAAGDRVELIEGEVLTMSPIGPPHNAAVMRANLAFVRAAGDRANVSIQSTMRLDDYTAPEPDVAVFRPRDDFYASRLPGPDDTLLIVEVADSSLAYDRTVKSRVYAKAGVPEYWIADIPNDRIVVLSEPEADAYRTLREYRRGERITPGQLPDCGIAVEDLLP